MATTEVSDILTISECLEEANVYGVKVPGNVSRLQNFWRHSVIACSRSFCYGFYLCQLLLHANAGHEGRIGMAAITVKEGAQFNGGQIYTHVLNYLPSYARPRFIRIQVTDHNDTVQLTLVGDIFTFFFRLAVFFSLLECYGGDRDIQANEGKAGGGGF